ncbi:DnaJ domain-containing protein [Phyllosticta citriasiana]|uniref:DnaJ domain-containing protein n=1 Tax=Phyllosticta citriasiana TaxID=595635 RepID=A0ABR1KK35_9PEZI
MSKDDVSDEAKALVSTDINLYELLGIEPTADAKQLKSAWRKTSLKYHPDKNQDNPEAVEKFYLAKNAVELLSNPTLRAQYDTSREARAQKERANALLDAKRRQMVADLEAGERGAKRKRAEEADAEERLQRELKRLAQDGERRRREREEQKAKEREEEARHDYEREMRRRSGVHVQPNGAGSSRAEERATAATATPGTLPFQKVKISQEVFEKSPI